MEVENISGIIHCYGCGVCAIICPKKIIKIELDKEGFYGPVLFNKEACIKCGLCLSVCAYSDDKLLDSNDKEVNGYAAWSNDVHVRRKCSSGGISFELGIHLINQGYKACGVRFNPELNRAEHFMASETIEFIPSIGSKYIQSYTVPGFSKLNRSDKFLVTGTPCQIDSIRRFIRKLKIEENFVLVDFFCHGVPSMNMWEKYTKMVEKKIGKICYASWRNKITAWHDSWIIGIESENEWNNEVNNNDKQGNLDVLIKKNRNFSYTSSFREGDLFYYFFLKDLCLGRACYDKCKYRYDQSAADIRIGDLWGRKYSNDEKGVSALLVFTELGNKIISQLDRCTIIKEDLSVVTEAQDKVSPKKPSLRKYLLTGFNSKLSLKTLYKLYQIYLLVQRGVNKIIRLIKFKD